MSESGRRRLTALVTGATAGIGAAFVRRLAAEGYDLVLVARDGERLAESAARIGAEHGVKAVTLPADLATDAGCAEVEARLRDPGEPIDILINNAGIGLRRSFLRSTLEDEEGLLRLNVHAVLRLTFAVLPGMIERGRGDVINVSSVAGFGVTAPGSTYSASKAWVTNFSESIALVSGRHGVRLLALCPGFTRTEFHQRAGIPDAGMPGWMWLQADDVARVALADLRKGKTVSVPDWKYKVAVLALRHTPRPILRRALGGAGRRVGRAER